MMRRVADAPPRAVTTCRSRRRPDDDRRASPSMMMNRLAWLAVLGAAGCAAEQSSDPITQIGAGGVRLPVAGVVSSAEPPSWDYVDEQLGGAGVSAAAAP